METVMLSVIVPIYQVENYLRRCLDTIVSQTYRDYELILVNDGTKDGCPAIMEEYARRDSRIRLIHKENGGLSSARNAGLEIARGKYVIFIDSDDYIEPTLFKDAVAAAEESGAEQVLWNYRKVDDQRSYGPFLKMEDETVDLDKLGFAEYYYRYWIPYKHGQEAWCRLLRRDVIESNGLRFQPNNEIFAEDLLFTAMYLMHTHKMVSLSKPYVNYYQREDSLMGMKKPKLAHRMMTLSVRLCEYVQQQGKEKDLQHVLPVFCYNSLICKGIGLDPDMQDVYVAMREYAENETLRTLLRRLIGPLPLTLFTLKVHKGVFMHIRARLIALRWLRGDVEGAAALVHRQEV